MPKLSLNTTLNYSPNFDLKKRKPNQIKFIIFHYTGMKSEKQAIDKLTNYKSKVSCHYFIKKNGEIISMIPDLFISWHAGVSSWKSYKSLNINSIGIEISNPGHAFGYEEFSKNQINALLKLSKFLISKYNIDIKNILGHSDIAPNRKKDPGEKFPWKFLAQKKISYWHNIKKNKLIKLRNYKVSSENKKKFFENLIKIGYTKSLKYKESAYYKKIVYAFQRRFRQDLINGNIDKECLLISHIIAKKSL